MLIPSAAWTDEVLEDISLGLEVLPSAARGGPLEIELHPEVTALGLGDSTHPALTLALGLTRLHLYGYRESEDARANARLSRLSSDERRRLWRRRAVVSALVRRLDARWRWSARAGWRALAGWEGGQPLLVYPWAFSRHAGMDSAALDLATFAEELLVPAESVLPLAVSLDDRLRCREPSKARFLDERLTAIDPSWKPVHDCPAFDAWADVEHLPKFEVVYAAPSASSAQALFGHLLLRIVRADDGGPGEVQVMQLAALISPLEPVASYISRGLGGGFRGVFSLTSLADVRQEALGLEQRSLRRFALELSAEQRLRLLERVWELERVGYIDYRFFKANCATMLRFLLAPALGERAPGPTLTPWETPTQVLDGLAQLFGAVETDEPSGTVARRATEERRRLLEGAAPSVRQGLEGPREARVAVYRALTTPGDSAPQRAWPEEATTRGDSPTREARPAASRAVTRTDRSGENEETTQADSENRTATAAAARAEAWRARVLLASLRIERFSLDEANVARIDAERATVLPGWTGPSTDDLVAARQRRYEHETSARRRAQAELADLLALDALLRAAPRRAFTLPELAVLGEERAARETFDAVAAAVASLPEDALSLARAEERQALVASEAQTRRRAVPEGGHGHAELGLGVLFTGTPVLRLRGAALFEQLGDQRQRGFGSRSAWSVLDATLELQVASQPVHRAGFTLLNIRSVIDSGWGWGAGVDYGFHSRAHEVAAAGEVLRVLAEDLRFTHFLMLTAGVRAGVRVEPVATAVVYPRAGLALRLQLPGSFGNAVRFEGAYLPRLRAGPFSFEHGVVGAIQVSMRLGVLGVAFTARGDVQAQWRPDTGLIGLAALGVELD